MLPIRQLEWQMAFLQTQLSNEIKAEQRWTARLQEAEDEIKNAQIAKANIERAILSLLSIYKEH